jgi:hypothetical protein
MHYRRTIPVALPAFKWNICQKHVQYVHELFYPTTTKIYKFKGATKQNIFVHVVSLAPHTQFLRPKIDLISVNSKQNFKKEFSP